jgi:hypothetical protein
VPPNTRSLRHELNHLTDAQQLPILLIMLAFWIVCAVELTQRLLGVNPDPRFWPFLSLIITVYGGFQVFRLRCRVRPSGFASPDKNEVTKILDQNRGQGFVAFHNLPGTSRSIDHVVVGASGIYAIETKVRSGSGTIDYRGEDELVFAGRIKDGWPLRQARASAGAVQGRLNEAFDDSYSVKPLVVFLGNWNVQRQQEHLSVDVTTANKLVDYFNEQKPSLTEKEIAALVRYFDGAATA